MKNSSRIARWRRVRRMAEGVAHNLGTPLSVIMGRAEMIIGGEVSASELELTAKSIKDSAVAMREIIDSLLEYGRRKEPHRTRTDLHQLVKRSLRSLEGRARTSGVSFVVTSNPSPPLNLLVDADQMQRALTNILLNGVESMTQGGVLTCSISRESLARENGDGVANDFMVVSVRDQGVGIAARHQATIFEPFFTTKDIGEGIGLGLSIAEAIVEDHGGWITVESELDRGSEFRTYLPDERTAPHEQESASRR